MYVEFSPVFQRETWQDKYPMNILFRSPDRSLEYSLRSSLLADVSLHGVMILNEVKGWMKGGTIV